MGAQISATPDNPVSLSLYLPKEHFLKKKGSLDQSASACRNEFAFKLKEENLHCKKIILISDATKVKLLD